MSLVFRLCKVTFLWPCFCSGCRSDLSYWHLWPRLVTSIMISHTSFLTVHCLWKDFGRKKIVTICLLVICTCFHPQFSWISYATVFFCRPISDSLCPCTKFDNDCRRSVHILFYVARGHRSCSFSAWFAGLQDHRSLIVLQTYPISGEGMILQGKQSSLDGLYIILNTLTLACGQ